MAGTHDLANRGSNAAGPKLRSLNREHGMNNRNRWLRKFSTSADRGFEHPELRRKDDVTCQRDENDNRNGADDSDEEPRLRFIANNHRHLLPPNGPAVQPHGPVQTAE